MWFPSKKPVRLVRKKYQGNKYVKKFTCWNHLLVMIFAQLTHRESLRDLIATLNAHKTKFNRLGFGTSVTRSNLSKANEQREAKIFEDMAYHMVKTARDLRIGLVDKDFFYEGNVYAFDSTTISLCLNVFWWSKLHHDKGGVKMHTFILSYNQCGFTWFQGNERDTLWAWCFIHIW